MNWIIDAAGSMPKRGAPNRRLEDRLAQELLNAYEYQVSSDLALSALLLGAQGSRKGDGGVQKLLVAVSSERTYHNL